MKKFITVLTVIAIAVSVCACGVAKLPTYDELKGTVSGDVYENEYLGIKFVKPSTWSFSTEEEIAEIAGTTADILEEGGVEEVEVGAEYFDMMAQDGETGNNINCSLRIVGNTGSVDFDEIIGEIEESILGYGESIGFNYTFSDTEVVTLCGIEFHKFNSTADYLGITFKQAGYVALEKGVLINFNITVMDDSNISDIEAMFQ